MLIGLCVGLGLVVIALLWGSIKMKAKLKSFEFMIGQLDDKMNQEKFKNVQLVSKKIEFFDHDNFRKMDIFYNSLNESFNRFKEDFTADDLRFKERVIDIVEENATYKKVIGKFIDDVTKDKNKQDKS